MSWSIPWLAPPDKIEHGKDVDIDDRYREARLETTYVCMSYLSDRLRSSSTPLHSRARVQIDSCIPLSPLS